jgi:hypothetical protein
MASIFVHIVAAITILIFIIPLQIKQAGVKNGLIRLRKQLLARESINLGIIAISIIVLATRFSGMNIDFIRVTLGVMIFIQALGMMFKAFIDFKIYRQQYSPANILVHEKIAVLEKARVKREEKAKI